MSEFSHASMPSTLGMSWAIGFAFASPAGVDVGALVAGNSPVGNTTAGVVSADSAGASVGWTAGSEPPGAGATTGAAVGSVAASDCSAGAALSAHAATANAKNAARSIPLPAFRVERVIKFLNFVCRAPREYNQATRAMGN